MTATRATLTQAILHVRTKFVGSGECADYAAINRGYCGDFADDVTAFLGEDARHHPSFETLGIAEFMEPISGGGFNDGYPFDRALLEEDWPEVRPTHGLSWDELDVLSEYHGFSAGTHLFIRFEERFYDSEAPDGVPSFLELPFFDRVIQRWIADGKPSIDAGEPASNMFAR
ncbi:hypothetical protein G6L37_01560 [Agrobacterium rubi]|nr:hypothetical protein [Agrobacterium rubi]NTF24080.1 hypothetical protein [Agrobacterium rubi]